MACPLLQLDNLLSSLLLPDEAGEPSASESYLIRRLRMNFRLDFEDLRREKYRRITKSRFATRGPNLTGLRQLLLRIATKLRFFISGVPNCTSDLWQWLYDLATWPSGHFSHLCNNVNRVPAPADTYSVRYLPMVYFKRCVGTVTLPSMLSAEFQKWLSADPAHQMDFISKLGSRKSPCFYTSHSCAPHSSLPPGVVLGTPEAAEHVVRELGLPGHEDSTRRAGRQGVAAVIIPTAWLEFVRRPTFMEALAKAYFFLPGPVGGQFGQTWPLTPCMSKNDRSKMVGCAEWVAGVDSTKVDFSKVRIEFVGPLS